jgi:hypothetical protein
MAEFPQGCLLLEVVAFRREDHRSKPGRIKPNPFARFHFWNDSTPGRPADGRTVPGPRGRSSERAG